MAHLVGLFPLPTLIKKISEIRKPAILLLFIYSGCVFIEIKPQRKQTLKFTRWLRSKICFRGDEIDDNALQDEGITRISLDINLQDQSQVSTNEYPS